MTDKKITYCSTPMRGLTEKQVADSIHFTAQYCEDNNLQKIHSYVEDNILYTKQECLHTALFRMLKAEQFILFVNDVKTFKFDDYQGCRVEYEFANHFITPENIKVIETTTGEEYTYDRKNDEFIQIN